ncbi:MAG TPA: methyltransferase [Bryobacteraceae bacterium]|nr:methyltransferase [Bryobacteraceae bacterium]
MLKPLSLADAQRLREFFRQANYTHQEFEGRRFLAELPSRSGTLPLMLDHTREPTLPNLILRLFFLNVPVTAAHAESLVPASIVAALVESGMLVRGAGGTLSSTVMLTPCDECLFAADRPARLDSHPPDLVIWPNPTTRLLHQFTIRRPSRATLDLGSGCGIQAIFAAAHSETVVATDLNLRAEEFTRFNAWLNGVANIECLTGDTFGPVRNRQFDLIVANPPFFVTPSSDQIYCENQMELDQYCRRIAREAPAHLNEGGYLQMVCEWVAERGQSWQDRLREWIADSGCDAWVFRGYVRDTAGYARERIRQTAPDESGETLQRWLDYYRERGVAEIHGGIVAMRRRSGPNWVRFEEMPLDPNQPFGEAVCHAFASIDQLEQHGSDDELLAAHLRLYPDTQLDQQFRQSGGRWQTRGMALRFTGGIPGSMRLEPMVADFLGGMDGSTTLAELIEGFARKAAAPPEVVQRECLSVIRRLMERRFILH